MQTKCDYQRQDSNLTLRAGIEEYYAANPHLLLPSVADAEARYFFQCHDRVHVVFGCDTSFLHEVRADFWTFFAVDVGFTTYLGLLRNSALKMLAADLEKNRSKAELRLELKRSARSAIKAPYQIFSKSRKMTKRWPWENWEPYMDRSLRSIREEFNIDVL